MWGTRDHRVSGLSIQNKQIPVFLAMNLVRGYEVSHLAFSFFLFKPDS